MALSLPVTGESVMIALAQAVPGQELLDSPIAQLCGGMNHPRMTRPTLIIHMMPHHSFYKTRHS